MPRAACPSAAGTLRGAAPPTPAGHMGHGSGVTGGHTQGHQIGVGHHAEHGASWLGEFPYLVKYRVSHVLTSVYTGGPFLYAL